MRVKLRKGSAASLGTSPSGSYVRVVRVCGVCVCSFVRVVRVRSVSARSVRVGA